MIRMRNILVPLDLSDYAAHALPYARELADTFGARLHLLHVVDSQWVAATGAAAFPEVGGDLLPRFEAEGGKALVQVAESLPAGIEVEGQTFQAYLDGLGKVLAIDLDPLRRATSRRASSSRSRSPRGRRACPASCATCGAATTTTL